jgi:hypothetical protein
LKSGTFGGIWFFRLEFGVRFWVMAFWICVTYNSLGTVLPSFEVIRNTGDTLLAFFVSNILKLIRLSISSHSEFLVIQVIQLSAVSQWEYSWGEYGETGTRAMPLGEAVIRRNVRWSRNVTCHGNWLRRGERVTLTTHKLTNSCARLPPHTTT